MNKIIHQTWKTVNLPEIINIRWINSWLKTYPAWEYKFWTDYDNRNLVEKAKPEILEIYDNYPFPIQRADVIRYFYMYYLGGIYVDLDFFSIKNMENILTKSDVVIGSFKTKNKKYSVQNAFIYSIKGHPFWNYCIEQLAFNIIGVVHETTGSYFLKKCLIKFKPSRMHLLKSDLVYPINWEKCSIVKNSLPAEYYQSPEVIFPNSYAVTFWTGTWFRDGGHEEK
jgi:mannosyltransferase OCH1-like enzyme